MKPSKQKKSLSKSTFKCYVRPECPKATAIAKHFKMNKRRNFKMLQRILTPNNERQKVDFPKDHNQRKIRSVNKDEEQHSETECLSTSKYRKVTIILNNKKFSRANVKNIATHTTAKLESESIKVNKSYEIIESQEKLLSTSMYKRVHVKINGIDFYADGSSANDPDAT